MTPRGGSCPLGIHNCGVAHRSYRFSIVKRPKPKSPDSANPQGPKTRARMDQRRLRKLQPAVKEIRAEQDEAHEAKWKRLLAIPAAERSPAETQEMKDMAGVEILREALYPPDARKRVGAKSKNNDSK